MIELAGANINNKIWGVNFHFLKIKNEKEQGKKEIST
jgi:hypothetical protein